MCLGAGTVPLASALSLEAGHLKRKHGVLCLDRSLALSSVNLVEITWRKESEGKVVVCA